MKTSDYKELDVWRKSIELTKLIYVLVKKFPNEEKYGLSDQMRRSAVSVPSNIAEGHGRNSWREFVNFLSIARGSLCELETQLIIAVEVGLLQKCDIEAALILCADVGKMLRGLSSYLERAHK